MGFVTAADPASKATRAFTNVVDFTYAMEKLKYIPLRPDGTPFIVHFIADEGGYLMDGAPLNVWFDGVWYEGQKEVAQKYWGSNGVPTPAQTILGLPVVAMPAPIAETYHAFKEQQAGAGGLFTSGNVMLLAGAGVLLLLATSVGGSKSRRHESDDYGE
jgi:hypothetical protein